MEGPKVLRWETLTKKQFDAIDRARAVVLVTGSPSACCASCPSGTRTAPS